MEQVFSDATWPNGPSLNHVKLKLKTFSGNTVEWNTFIESFTEVVDKNNIYLTWIEKMNYLVGFLADETAAAIKRLQLSNENYN